MKKAGMALLALAAFGSSAAAAQAGKEAKIIGYLLGSAPAGMDEVVAALNQKLKADVNATMEVNYVGWDGWRSKYPLLLAAGEDIDWIYTASWAMYGSKPSRAPSPSSPRTCSRRTCPAITPRWDNQAGTRPRSTAKYTCCLPRRPTGSSRWPSSAATFARSTDFRPSSASRTSNPTSRPSRTMSPA